MLDDTATGIVLLCTSEKTAAHNHHLCIGQRSRLVTWGTKITFISLTPCSHLQGRCKKHFTRGTICSPRPCTSYQKTLRARDCALVMKFVCGQPAQIPRRKFTKNTFLSLKGVPYPSYCDGANAHVLYHRSTPHGTAAFCPTIVAPFYT